MFEFFFHFNSKFNYNDYFKLKIIKNNFGINHAILDSWDHDLKHIVLHLI